MPPRRRPSRCRAASAGATVAVLALAASFDEPTATTITPRSRSLPDAPPSVRRCPSNRDQCRILAEDLGLRDFRRRTTRSPPGCRPGRGTRLASSIGTTTVRPGRAPRRRASTSPRFGCGLFQERGTNVQPRPQPPDPAGQGVRHFRRPGIGAAVGREDQDARSRRVQPALRLGLSGPSTAARVRALGGLRRARRAADRRVALVDKRIDQHVVGRRCRPACPRRTTPRSD